MKKLRRFLSLCLASSFLMGLNVQAQPISKTKDEVAKLEIRVNGHGKVTIDDGYSKYSLEDRDIFSADCTLDTKLQITATPDSGYYVSSVEGLEKVGESSGNSRIYDIDYINPNGTFISINFSEEKKEENNDKEINKEINKEEIKQEQSESETNIETSENNKDDNKEKDKEEIKEDVKEQATFTDTVLSRYSEGIYYDTDLVEYRKKLVDENSLHDYVDSDYFFNQEYLEAIKELEIGELIALVRVSKKDLALEYRSSNNTVYPSIKELINIGRPYLDSLIKTGLFVTNHGNLVVYEGGILMGQSDMFSLNGNIAYCADHHKISPSSGQRIISTSQENNSLIRKILYYGFGGPAEITGWASNTLRVSTGLAISQVRHSNGGSLGRRLLSQVQGLAEPPSGFTVYIGDTGNNSLQKLAYWQFSPKGSLEIHKSSTDPSITNGNNNYSTKGARYGVYKNPNATDLVDTLVIGDWDWSQEIQLDAGTYYIREISAPKGYALDNTIYPMTITAGNKSVGWYSDRPLLDPISILVRKIDSETGLNKPQGTGSLADAHFTIKYYGGDYPDGVDPALNGISPTRTWVLKTDNDGFCSLKDSYKVSGDPFYYDNGFPSIPLGLITIQETKAPGGYKINPEVFIRKITTNPIGGIISYNEPVVREDIVKFTIKKVQSGTSNVLANVKFKHTRPNGASSELQTGANGEVVIRGLEQGVHRIIETQTLPGYDLNPNEFVFEVLANNSIRVISNTTNMGMSYGEVNGNGILTVENSLSAFKIKVVKVNNKNAFLEGAEFTLYSDSACTVEVGKAVSNINGELVFNNLKVGVKYYFKETKAPHGYRIPVDASGNVHVYEVMVDTVPTDGVYSFTVDGIRYNSSSLNGDVHLEGNVSDRIISIKVVNAVMMKLPATGSNLMIPLMALGSLLMFGSLVLNRKKEV